MQAAGFVNACSMDMCIAEGNRTKQKELLCDVYSDLDLACKEVLPEWISHWRDITNCRNNLNYFYYFQDEFILKILVTILLF